MEEKDFTPLFKENDNEQFVFEDGEWVKSNEDEIGSLWQVWVCADKAKKFRDKDGYIVFGYTL